MIRPRAAAPTDAGSLRDHQPPLPRRILVCVHFQEPSGQGSAGRPGRITQGRPTSSTPFSHHRRWTMRGSPAEYGLLAGKVMTPPEPTAPRPDRPCRGCETSKMRSGVHHPRQVDLVRCIREGRRFLQRPGTYLRHGHALAPLPGFADLTLHSGPCPPAGPIPGSSQWTSAERSSRFRSPHLGLNNSPSAFRFLRGEPRESYRHDHAPPASLAPQGESSRSIA